MSRFLPTQLFLGQFKTLSDYRSSRIRPDIITRALIFGAPIVIFSVMALLRVTLTDVSSMIAGSAILAGTLLAAFGQLSSWRSDLREQARLLPDEMQFDLDSLDETVTHILAAAYTSGLATVLLVLSSNFGSRVTEGTTHHGGIWVWLGCSVASHAALTFLIAVPRLYYAYASVNRVRRELTNIS